jgi:putative membrane protein
MSDLYCGAAPVPETLMGAWRLDLVALLACAGILVAWRRFGAEAGRLPIWIGVGLIAALFLSPLCALTVALFSARTVHHVLLLVAVAPLLAMAFPAAPRSRQETVPLGLLAAIQAVVLWFWHIPPVYSVAISVAAVYWAMQASLLGVSFCLWQRALRQSEDAGAVVFAMLGTSIQMGLLGALLTFAPTPLYEAHLDTTHSFGLTPLSDQQLAGLIMWVPAALPYLAAALFRVWPMLGSPGRRAGWSG